MDATVNNPGSAFAGDATDFVAPEGVASVDTDADDVARMDRFGEDLLQGFVDQDGVAGDLRGCCCENEEPTRGDYGGAKGVVARIYEMNTQESNLSSCRVRWVHRVFDIGTNRRPSCGWRIECRPGRFLPGYVVHHTEAGINYEGDGSRTRSLHGVSITY